MTEPSNKSRMVKDTLIYSGANYISQAIGIFNSILLRRFLGPASMGVWGVIQVILDYAGQASLGTTRAMARDYPFYKGRGETTKAEAIKDTTLSFTMAMSWVPFFAVLGYLLFNWTVLDPQFRYCLVFLLGFLFLQRFYDFVITLLRSDKKFKTLSLVIVLNAVLGLLATVLVVRYFGIYGLLWTTAVIMLGVVFVCVRRENYRFLFHIDWRVLLSELKLAVPLAVSAFLITALRGMDKMIIADKLGFYDVGIYSIAMMVANYILSVPMMFSQVWFPNLQQAFGKNNGDLQAVKHYLEKPLLGLAIILPVLCAISFIAMPVLIHYYLQDFAAGIPVMRLYLVGLFFLMLGQFSLNFLVTAGKYWVVAPILVLAIGINYFGGIYFVTHDWGLQGVAFATVIAYAVYGVGCLMLALKQAMNIKERRSIMFRSVIVYLVLFFLVFAVDGYTFRGGVWAVAGLKTGIYFVLFIPLAFWLEKEMKIFVEFRKIVSDKINFISNKSRKS